MKTLKNIKKGQSLPLNTIVIAILVIIVLVVIVGWFIVKMGQNNGTIDNNDPTSCNIDANPTLKPLGYINVDEQVDATTCTDKGGSVVHGVNVKTTGYVCCGYKQ